MRRYLLAVIILITAFGSQLQAATYYIDFNAANDSANGTSTSTPWKRAPGMVGFAGSYSHSNGDRFIFKGGVTWTSGALPLTVANSGAAGNPDYYGVDAAWYTGGAWARPIFDSEYANGNVISFNTKNYISMEGIEMKRVSSSDTTDYGLIQGNAASHHWTLTNLYLHGWRTTAVTDDAHGGLIMGGAASSQIDTNIIRDSIIENSENIGLSAWGGGNGVAVRFWGTIYNTTIHDVSSAVLFCLDFDHSTLYNVALTGNDPGPHVDGGVYHPNGVYLDAETLGKTVAYIRNSVFHDIDNGANMSYLNGRHATLYNYNNVYYGVISPQMAIEIEPYDYNAHETSGTYHVYNNTGFIETGDHMIHIVDRSGSGGEKPLSIIIRNNHAIGTSVSIDDNGPAGSYTRSNNLIQTLATANGQGYTVGNLGQPTDAGDSTVEAGFDGSAIFTTDKLGVTRTIPWDIGAYEFGSGCTPAKLLFSSQPSNAVIGATLGTVSVGVYDSGDVLCTDDSTTSITLSENGSSTWGTLTSGSNLTKTVSSGVATWTDLSVMGSAGSGSIDASDGGALTDATSSSITIMWLGASRARVHR